MSLLDDVIVTAAAAVDAVGKKAGEVVDKSKNKVSSAELRKKISDKFETLGRYVYDTHMNHSTDEEVVGRYASEITELIGELKTLQDAINTASSKHICPKCACENSADSLYCRKCGTSLDFTCSYTVPTESKNDEAADKLDITAVSDSSAGEAADENTDSNSEE